MNALKDKIVKLQYVHQYMNQERFDMVFGRFASKHDLKELYRYCSMGLLCFLQHAPDEMIDAMESYGHTLEISFKQNYAIDKHPHWRKIIFEQGNEVFTKELDLCDYEGSKTLCSIYENADTILAVCRMCDEIDVAPQRRTKKDSYRSERLRIYEGDLVSTSDNYKGATQLILATLSGTYIGGDSVYRELIYNDKYGYLMPNGTINEDIIPIKFSDSIYNVHKDRYNYHAITMANDYRVIGNIATHFDLLRPIDHKTKTKKKSNVSIK